MQTQNNFKKVRSKIKSIAEEFSADEPDLIAVSKGQPAAKVAELLSMGWLDFGESRLQELESKVESLPNPEIRWHFIGQLQSRKIPKIVSICSSIHSVDNLKHAKLIDAAALKMRKIGFPIYISVNFENEEGKSGISPTAAEQFAKEISNSCPNILIKGLMTVPPAKYNDEQCSSPPDLYFKIRKLASQIGEGQLSMGMSSDLRISMMAGANTVRIGTEIFGERSLT